MRASPCGRRDAAATSHIVWRRKGNAYEIVEGEKWVKIDACLRKGYRGLKNQDGSIIADGLLSFRTAHGLIDAPKVPVTKPAAAEILVPSPRKVEKPKQVIKKRPNVPRVDLSDNAPEWIMLKDLWEQNGKPTSRFIWNSLPPENKQSDANGTVLFRSHNVINAVLVGQKIGREKDKKKFWRQPHLSKPQFDALIGTLKVLSMTSPRVNLADGSKDWLTVKELWERKGRPNGASIFGALPPEAKQPDAAGNVVCKSRNLIEGVLRGNRQRRQKSMKRETYATLLATLQTYPDISGSQSNRPSEHHRKKHHNVKSL